MEDNNDSTDEKIESKSKTLKNRVTVSVTEMNCTTCAIAIEKQVKKLRGVSEVKAAIMLNKVFIDYDPNLVNSATIRKAIDETGYKSYMTVKEEAAGQSSDSPG